MRRTEQDFKAEVLRRSEIFKKQRKKRIGKLLTALGCIALLILALPMLPLGMGGAEKAADQIESDIFYRNEAPQAPAADHKAESAVMGATGAAPMDAEPEEVAPPEDGSVYGMTVWLIHPDGTEDEWRVREADKIEAIVKALQAFEDISAEAPRLEGISEKEGTAVYILTYTANDPEAADPIRHTYEFYPEHHALWYAFDGGYWVGQDEQAGKLLLEALQDQ